MSWEQGYDAGNAGLIAAVNTAKMLGAIAERERIIKLLEPLGECEPAICGKGCRGEHLCIGWAYRHAIRLIKGENK